MHLQNERNDERMNSFLERKWVRRFSIGLAVLLILLMIIVSLDRRELPDTTGWVIIIASLTYILSDMKMRKTQDNKRS